MNRENIQKVRDHIAGLPAANFDMGDYGRSEPCGTVACIAGWVDIVVGAHAEPTGISSNARDLLDLNSSQAFDLFWAKDHTRLDEFDNPVSRWEATPAQAVQVLDHLLATGEVDWSIIDTDPQKVG